MLAAHARVSIRAIVAAGALAAGALAACSSGATVDRPSPTPAAGGAPGGGQDAARAGDQGGAAGGGTGGSSATTDAGSAGGAGPLRLDAGLRPDTAPTPDVPLPVCNSPEWTRATAYKAGDVVMFMGKPYLATHDNPGLDPTI